MNRIIGLCGGIGAGKDTVADYLIEAHGFQRVSFADPLKAACAKVYGELGVDPRHFFGSQLDKAEPIDVLSGVTGRKILETVGTQGFRAAYEDTWVDVALASSSGRIVTTDCRFPNEFAAIRARGGIVCRVSILGEAAPETGHESDLHWRQVIPDAAIAVARGDLAELREQADLLVGA